jgi:hypothetical protein
MQKQMRERPQRAVGGDPPAPTMVWLWFLPRPVQALRAPLSELLPGQEVWIWSSSGSIRRCAQALPINRLSLTSLYSGSAAVITAEEGRNFFW